MHSHIGLQLAMLRSNGSFEVTLLTAAFRALLADFLSIDDVEEHWRRHEIWIRPKRN